jgi:hypothetical protein
MCSTSGCISRWTHMEAYIHGVNMIVCNIVVFQFVSMSMV